MAEARLTGAILAGGAGRRMGGQDKGLVLLEGRPLVAWVIAALAPQVDELLIVANRNQDAYRAFGLRVVGDLRPGHAGPLAGLEAALTACTTPWLLTSPVDTPLLPPDLAQRLAPPAGGARVATLNGAWQPVFACLPVSTRRTVSALLDAGERRLRAGLEAAGAQGVAFDDEAQRLADIDDAAALTHFAAHNIP